MDTSLAQTITPTAAATAAARTASTQQKGLIGSDFTTFLKMLTTQIQNQDPLNPMESSDFAVQLATFSGVEQQMKTNQLLSGLNGQMGMMGMAQLAGWVGMEARAAAPAEFDGTPITLSPNPQSLADETVLVVKNAGGTVVGRIDIPVSAEPMTWAGTDGAGGTLPPGRYSFDLESRVAGAVIGTAPVEAYGEIIEARGGGDQTMLILKGGIQVPADKVTALRTAAPPQP